MRYFSVESQLCCLLREEVLDPCCERLRDAPSSEVVDEALVVDIVKGTGNVHEYS